uniref:Gypsy retrotransposon integrase-like protein 1 n=1 Tax=Leptobrachium leishanense TaxID=445787 RepID=A0A8C5QJQ2_9ANUR
MLRPVYQRMVEERKAPAEVGRLWRLGGTEKVLQAGEVASFWASVKLNGSQPGPYVVLGTDFDHGSETGVEVIPEIISRKALKRTRGRVSVSVCNVTDSPVVLKARMPIGQVESATPLSTDSGEGVGKEIPDERFYPKDAPISPEWKKRLQSQVLKWKELFSKDEFDVGLAKSTEHRIRLQEDKPFRERSRRVPLGDLDDLREQLNKLQRTKVIQESRSPYASPIVLVRKKNGSVRLCIDYRTLNRRTIPDQYAPPRIEDALQCLSGAKWFSVLDLRSGYHQIPMHPEDKEKTAFICPLGFFEFNRMPQGLTGAPATFQRLMEKTVGDMNLIEVLVYLDDIIVFGKTLEEHEQRLEKVLKRLHEEGLKLSLEKCQFCLPSVTYLGHVVSAEGVSTDPRNLEAVASWPRPRNVTELRSFLGFCSYYRRFVGGFAKIVQPLNKLLQKETTEEGCKVSDKNPSALGPRKARESIQGEWTSQCEGSFVKLKESLTRAPVLAYADPHKPYELHVDASRETLGGVLYQEYDGLLRPVAYVSRSLTPSEKNYPTHKLEFLALKWAVVDKLKDYLYGAEFVIKTDNNPLTYILTTAKLDTTGHRWLAALSGFRFSLKYRPGVNNRDADALSRRPYTTEWTQLTPDGVQALCQGTERRVKGGIEAEAIGVMAVAVPEFYCNPTQLRDESLPTFSRQDLKADQARDPLIALTIKALSANQREILLTNSPSGARLVYKEWERLKMLDGVVYRRGPSTNSEEIQQLFLPTKHRESVLRSLHDEHGHLGAERTFKLVRDRFYWPCMRAEVESYCHSCLRCIQRKTLPTRTAPMSHVQSQGPMDLVCIDFLCLELDASGQGNILIVTRHVHSF